MSNPLPTPRDVVQQLLSDSSDFPSLTALAAVSSRGYQTLYRWREDKVKHLPQDELADFVVDLERDPDEFGIQPSKAWRAKHDARSGVDVTGSSALDAHTRHEITMMRAELTIVRAELRAIRENFGIPAPKITQETTA